MYTSEVRERLDVLKRELDDIKQMNLRYWGHSEHAPLATAAFEARRLRLTGIKYELAYLLKRAAESAKEFARS